jgi:hypothetical protein
VVRKIFIPKGENVAGRFSHFCKYAFARIIKSRRMECVGHMTSLGGLTNAYSISVDNLKGRDHFET